MYHISQPSTQCFFLSIRDSQPQHYVYFQPGSSVLYRLSCALQGVWHHLQPPPTRGQQQSLPPRLYQPKMSPAPKCPPGRGTGGQNQPQWRSTHLDDIAWLSEYLYELERKGSYFEFLCVSQVRMDETGNQ